jgi:hypothetical protein
MDYACTFTGGFAPNEIEHEALAMLAKMAAVRGDEIDTSTLSKAFQDGDWIFRAEPVLDADGLSPSRRRRRLEEIDAKITVLKSQMAVLWNERRSLKAVKPFDRERAIASALKRKKLTNLPKGADRSLLMLEMFVAGASVAEIAAEAPAHFTNNRIAALMANKAHRLAFKRPPLNAVYEDIKSWANGRCGEKRLPQPLASLAKTALADIA